MNESKFVDCNMWYYCYVQLSLSQLVSKTWKYLWMFPKLYNNKWKNEFNICYEAKL